MIKDHALAFPLLPLRFFAEWRDASTPKHLTANEYHGAFGRALHDTDTRAFGALFSDSDAGHSLPKPYWLNGPHFGDQNQVCFDFCLLGSACQYWPQVIKAFERLQQMGIGKQRYSFTVNSIAVWQGRDWKECLNNQGHFFPPQTIVLADLVPTKNLQSVLRLTFSTPLLLKSEGVLSKAAPSFDLLLHRLIGRLDGLLKREESGFCLGKDDKYALLEEAQKIHCLHRDLYWGGTARYSARQNKTMYFEGIIGSMVFSGQFKPFLPFLPLMSWLGIGNKTTFGCGKIDWLFLPETFAIPSD